MEQAQSRPLRILTFSTLYPNAAQPNHGVFVENRLRHLLETGCVEASVIAPVPWFPSGHRFFGRYAAFAQAPRHEVRHGVAVQHPRYGVIPRFGMTLAPLSMYRAIRGTIREMTSEGRGFDILDAHYFYPDGVAAALLAREFKVPFTITARGTDINLLPRYRIPRRMILWAARRADALITVCEALKDELIALGVSGEKIRTLRNGVDLKMFRPVPRQQARERFALEGPVLLSVGALIPRKRHDLVIRALPLIENAMLLIAGDGPELAALRQLVRELGVQNRVRFLGSVPHEQLAEIYTAADVLVLASTREGWANVLLEAMACGTPAIATNVWGAPEVIQGEAAGRLLDQATPEELADAVRLLLADPPERAETRRYAEAFGWDATSQGQLDLFAEILRKRGLRPTAAGAAAFGAAPEDWRLARERAG
ncbi:Glycosyl transferase family 1 [uncultured Defluviicoccus sp.]|uniref:Glycosyl transferase family 1 n=1 Tax=metagenome TaxID=256318 RepID=A0A380TG21_9ZZZZ|nr:Glycosyl transferase family 1 [uncultured Defluviicoccus sp.]